MPVIWNLREWLKERGVTRASQLRRIVCERTGYVLSNQAWGDLLNDQPKMVRIETSQALCDAFYCSQSDFFEVKPQAAFRSHPKTECPPNPLSPEDDSKVGTGTGKNAESEMSSENTCIDFAAYFPDARKFSSDLSTES
jgi:DNA-binding Xre family transcriptional regulator